MDELILLIIGFCITLIFGGGALIHGITQQGGSSSEPNDDNG